MRSYIIYCPHLNRDIRGLLNTVPNPRIYTGLPTPRGCDGCLESHHAIVRGAMQRGDRAVFVMEDDCRFTSHFKIDLWEAIISFAELRKYDVVVGGCTRTYEERVAATVEDTTLLQVSAFHSAHCIVYLQSSYERILQTVQPFDLSVGKQGCSILLTWPFVAVQAPSFSGILKQHVDYVPLYAAHEARLGHALGLLEPHIPMGAY